MKYIREAKTKKNITEAMISIIEEIISNKQIRFFIKDNITKNSIAI